MLKVKIKKLSADAVIPRYSNPGDAGLDLTATTRKYENGLYVYGTGLSIAIPRGYVGLIFPRSSISNYDLQLSNCVGVIDSDFRGEVKAKFKTSHNRLMDIYDAEDRIGQLIIFPYPQIEFEEVNELDETERGSGGFGSTGI